MTCDTPNCRFERRKSGTRCWACIRYRQRHGDWPVRLQSGQVEERCHPQILAWIRADLALLSAGATAGLEEAAADSGISLDALWLEVCKLELGYGVRRRPTGGRTAAEAEAAARRYLDE